MTTRSRYEVYHDVFWTRRKGKRRILAGLNGFYHEDENEEIDRVE